MTTEQLTGALAPIIMAIVIVVMLIELAEIADLVRRRRRAKRDVPVGSEPGDRP